jgi:hypothetical protein
VSEEADGKTAALGFEIHDRCCAGTLPSLLEAPSPENPLGLEFRGRQVYVAGEPELKMGILV